MRKLQTKPDGNIGKEIAALRVAFEYRCIYLLIEGYKSMKLAEEYNTLTWEEEQFTANLIKFMTALPFCNEWEVNVIPEYPIHDEDIQTGKKKPKEAPIIDIRLDSWSQKKQFIYFIEAKILVEKDFERPDGTIRASQKRTRYVNTGIDNFVSKRYPNGCLAGYVLQGKVDCIVEGLNRLLVKQRKRPTEVLRNVTITMSEDYPYCYQSRHEQAQLVLNHIFLTF